MRRIPTHHRAGVTLLALLMSGTACAPRTAPATLVLRSGMVVTTDSTHARAQAIAISGDTIVAVGSDAEIQPYIGSNTKVIELQGHLATTKGSLTRGSEADIAVLARDSMTTSPDSIPAAEVLYAIIGGKVIYKSQADKGVTRSAPSDSAAPEGASETLHVSSPAFPNGASIPAEYTCSGPGTIPPLSWSGVPTEAGSLALIVDDPDAPSGTFVHWVAYGIPPTATGVPRGGPLPAGSVSGVNSTRHAGYFGPCPPKGNGPHHYHFKLYALDGSFSLAPGATKATLLAAMKGHVLAAGETVGVFER